VNADISTGHDQVYNGAVKLGHDVTLAAHDVTFNSTVDSMATGNSVTVDYRNLGTFTTPALVQGGVTVTGSADVNVLNLNGLGIVGGTFDDTVDGNEFIDFDFGFGVSGVAYYVNSAGNLNGNGTVGDRTLEAFGVGGASLGRVPQSGTGSFD